MTFQRLRSGSWCRSLLLAALTGLLAGCSMPGKGNGLSGPLASLNPVQTASYQEQVIEEPAKEVSDPVGLKLRYAMWMEEMENFDEAQANYQVVLQERPEDVEAILGLARIDQAADRREAAEVGFKKALSLSPDSTVAKNAMGQFYASQQRWTEALPLLKEAMLGDPANKAYRFHLAVALAHSGDTTAALPHFAESVGEATAYFNVGMILKSQGKYRQAEQHFAQALTRDPNLEAAQQAIAQVRQQSQAAGTYAAEDRRASSPIQAAGHSRPASYAPALRPQLRNQRVLPR